MIADRRSAIISSAILRSSQEIKIRNNILLGEKDEHGEEGINCFVHKGYHSKGR